MKKPLHANAFMLFLLIYMELSPIPLQLLLYYLDAAGKDTTLLQQIIVGFGHIFIFGVPILLFRLISGVKFGDIFPHEKLTLLSIFLITIISFATMPIMNAAAAVTMIFADSSEYREATDYIGQFSLPFMMTAIAVMPAIFEEAVFRGVIMTGYKRSGILRSLFFSALYFGIMHMSLYQFLYAVMAGIVFGLLVQLSNSIYASILAHFIINGSQSVTAYMLGSNIETDAEQLAGYTNTDIILSAVFTLAIFVPITAALLYAFAHVNKGKRLDYTYSLSDRHEFESDIVQDKKDKRAFDPFLVLVLIIYIAYTAQELLPVHA